MPAELLSVEKHGRLRLRAADERATHFTQVFTREFAAAATCCPVLFTKDTATGGFFAGAVFGMKAGENLLGGAEERGGFTPLMLQREGFFLSGQHIAIDRDNDRFSETEGEPLFDGAGQPGPALRTIQRVLGEIHSGMEQTNTFIAAMTQQKLIEPIEISLAFEGGERLSLQGLYCVSLDRLRELDDAAALALFRAGHLQHAYTMNASLKQIARLARLREQRKRRGSADS